MARRTTALLRRVPATSVPSPALVRARFEGLTPAGEILICVGGRISAAAVAVSASEHELLDAIRGRRDVLLGFLEDDTSQPVVLGLLRSRLDATPTASAPEGSSVKERYVEIDATDGVRIRAGDASIELSADGRVEIRGVEVISSAEGANRILGGSVGIN